MKRPFFVDEYVRWSDVDYAGIIFYGAYVGFFEIAETELFRDAGMPYGEVFDRFDMWLPRAHLSCDFSYPARLDDQLRVAVYISDFGRTSIRIHFDVVHRSAGVLAASAHEVLVCTDRETLRPRTIPPEFRELLEPYHMATKKARHALGISEVK
ncbi:MAG: thioesterase family protein [Gemmatimonadales bacterium]